MPVFTHPNGTKVETEAPAEIVRLKSIGFVEGTKTEANKVARKAEKAAAAAVDPVVVLADPEENTKPETKAASK